MADQQLVLGTYQSVFDNLKINKTEAEEDMDQLPKLLIDSFIQVLNHVLDKS
jgi:hypothetical protein